MTLGSVMCNIELTLEEDQLITHWLYLPGLSTAVALDYCIPYSDLRVLLLRVL